MKFSEAMVELEAGRVVRTAGGGNYWLSGLTVNDGKRPILVHEGLSGTRFFDSAIYASDIFAEWSVVEPKVKE